MKKKKIAVIGLGDFGIELVKRLHEDGHEVTAVDQDEVKVDKIKDECTYCVTIDSTDESELREHGLEDMDTVVIAIGDNFENLIVTADVLRRMNVKSIYARYQYDLDKRVLKMLGIENLFNPEEQAARSMAEQLGHTGVKGVTAIGEDFRMLEIILPKGMSGKTLAQCKFREEWNLNLVTVKRPKKALKKGAAIEDVLGIPQPDLILKQNDVLVLFGKQKDLEKLIEN
ncbi:potassium uptake system NAD-binding protein [Leptospira perolatii]|uniref:Potassium uptake system NAD-binding protein n=1 Tax=Leptospira perolatii TaxID=2023191 RepID=A0A2M9ZS75_9LEPT|nr:TrkA family potassium uptake protein [Leptospira perolatii]PJZ71340.1 potassium uptake system NAD-binding protein [Leptospira perolatii]PJZ74874.1 potassium uptake system NAD-binding protein [Leptospira perolatii]